MPCKKFTEQKIHLSCVCLVTEDKLSATGDIKPKVISDPRTPRGKVQIFTFTDIQEITLVTLKRLQSVRHNLLSPRQINWDEESCGSDGIIVNHIMPPKLSSKGIAC